MAPSTGWKGADLTKTPYVAFQYKLFPTPIQEGLIGFPMTHAVSAHPSTGHVQFAFLKISLQQLKGNGRVSINESFID